MRASDRAYQALLHEIQSGALAPGTVLNEAEQAARLGVSRTPMREALGRLSADRLVIQLSPRVTVVTSIDATDVQELYDVRRALEETAARLAAGRAANDPQLSALFAEFAEAFSEERADALAGADEYYALIDEFDAQLDAAANNEHLTAALRIVRTHLVRVRALIPLDRARLLASIAEHRLIAQAIAAGDIELAAHATHVHLHHGLISSLAALAERIPSPLRPLVGSSR